MNYTLITDGAFSSSRNQGGLAFIFIREDGKLVLEYSKMVKNTTNNRMELGAIILGLRAIKGSIDCLTVVTDSMYCLGCATKGWKRKKNVQLWETFDKEYTRIKSLCKEIKWIHVRGHQKDDSEFTKWNNYCDKLAVNASQQL